MEKGRVGVCPHSDTPSKAAGEAINIILADLIMKRPKRIFHDTFKNCVLCSVKLTIHVLSLARYSQRVPSLPRCSNTGAPLGRRSALFRPNTPFTRSAFCPVAPVISIAAGVRPDAASHALRVSSGVSPRCRTVEAS